MQILRTLLQYVFPAQGNAYRPHLLKHRLLLLFLVLTLAAEGVLILNLGLRYSAPELLSAVIRSEIVSLTNSERAALGARPLRAHALLEAAAQRKAEDMAARGYFAHTSPEGKEPWAWLAEEGYEYRFAGENLAVRFVDSRDVVVAWMASPAHRANVVKPQYADIGVGVASGEFKGKPATYVVQYFASPSAAFGEGLASPQGAAAAQSRPLADAALRQFARFAAEPRESAALVLGSVAALLALLVAAAALRKVQIQPVAMLAQGALVALLALSLVWLNGALLAPGRTSSPQIAAAIDSLRMGEVVIGEAAAAEPRFLFP